MIQTRRMWLTATAIALAIPVYILGPQTSAGAGETAHYVPEASDTLDAAVANFATFSARVDAVMARDPLTVDDMEEVHELTYTLELALAKMNEELSALPEVLETLHKASEGDDVAGFKTAAEAYLTKARAFTP